MQIHWDKRTKNGNFNKLTGGETQNNKGQQKSSGKNTIKTN